MRKVTNYGKRLEILISNRQYEKIKAYVGDNKKGSGKVSSFIRNLIDMFFSIKQNS